MLSRWKTRKRQPQYSGEENEIYLSSSCWITKEQLIELDTPEKRAAYLAEEARAFDEAYEAGKHMLIGSGGFVILDD